MAPPYRPPDANHRASPHVNMQKLDSTAFVDGYENWSSDQLADYFEDHGLGDYREVIMYHRITGKIAPQLTNDDLKDMGIDIVGDRCRFRHHLKSISRKARAEQRNRVIWMDKERLFFGCADWGVSTCCGLIPEDPSTYKLTNNHLKIRLVDPIRIGPIRLCCGHKYSVNNLDLTYVDDVDMVGVPAPCVQQCLCCANGMEILELSTNEGEFQIVLKEGEGEFVSTKIMNQVEECQMIERD